MFLTAIKDTFAQIGDDNKGYDVYVNQKIREYAREKNDEIGANHARKYLAHLMRYCRSMPKEKKWEQVQTLWDIGALENEKFNEFCKWIIEQDGWKASIEDGYEDGGLDIIAVKGTKQNPEYLGAQCKNWKFKSIGENQIENFIGKPRVQDAIKNNTHLVYITSSFYTQNAKEVADLYHILLIDYRTLIEAYPKYQKSLQK